MSSMRSPSPRQFERLLRLDELLRSRRAATVKALASALEVSARTVHSDLGFLRDRYNAPIERDRRGYYYRESDWRLPLVPLTQGELFALVLGSRMLEAAAGAAYSQELQSAIDQLVRRMPEQTWADLQTIVEERIQFGGGSLIDLNPEYWRNLTEASRTNRVVEMTYYTASSDSISTRKLNPYLMFVYRGTNPHVIGFCHKRQEVRDFRVDRIRALRFTGDHFERDATFNARQYLDAVFQIQAGGQPHTIAIRFTTKVAPYIRERRWHPTQQIIEYGDGSLTLKLTVPGLSEVKRWVMGYGEDAMVEEPAELVEMVRTELARMAANY